MESPNFPCPECGGREWYKDHALNSWYCKHEQPSDEITLLPLWIDYILRKYDELLKEAEKYELAIAKKKEEGKVALIETVRARQLRDILREERTTFEIAALLLDIIKMANSGTISLSNMRFRWGGEIKNKNLEVSEDSGNNSESLGPS